MIITERTTIAEIASTLPSSVRVFQQHGIDFCCGGKTALASACQQHRISFTDIVNDIETSARDLPMDERDWNAEPLHVLIAHIILTYHDALREELPRLESMAAKVSRVHGANARTQAAEFIQARNHGLLVGEGHVRAKIGLAAQREEPGAHSGQVRGQRVATTVTTRLGEWVELGGAGSQEARDERGIAAARTTRSTQSRRVWLKVEELP